MKTTIEMMVLVITLSVIPISNSQADGSVTDGGINTCVSPEFDGNGESENSSACLYTANNPCDGNCSKYVTSGDTSSCYACAQSGARFWSNCKAAGTGVTYLNGNTYSSSCVQEGITEGWSCGCDEENWTLQSSTTVPCYHATGDSCWF